MGYVVGASNGRRLGHRQAVGGKDLFAGGFVERFTSSVLCLGESFFGGKGNYPTP